MITYRGRVKSLVQLSVAVKVQERLPAILKDRAAPSLVFENENAKHQQPDAEA
jgi:hypothetical protein